MIQEGFQLSENQFTENWPAGSWKIGMIDGISNTIDQYPNERAYLEEIDKSEGIILLCVGWRDIEKTGGTPEARTNLANKWIAVSFKKQLATMY